MPHALFIEVTPRTALSAERYAELVALCERAYDEPFDEIMASFEEATHVLGTLDGAVVSHALWVPRTLYTANRVLQCAYVEAVATEPAYQGRGYASAVLRALVPHLSPFDVAALSPSDAAFYERLGWERWHGALLVRSGDGDMPTPDEEAMIYRLPGSAGLDTSQPLTATWRDGDIW